MPLHEYQKTAARFLYQRPQAGVFADPGAGKTLIVLAVLNQLLKEQPDLKVLIVAPLRVARYVWPQEIAKWTPALTHKFLHGKDKTEEHSGAHIELINPEGLKWLVKNRKPEHDVLIVDESSKFKNGRSIRFRLLKTWLNAIPRRYILTGTPIPRSLLDLWSQIFLLDQGDTLGKYITYYRNRFFIERRFRNFSEYELRTGAEEDIWGRIAHLVLRVDADLDMPELIENPIYVELPPKVRKVYDYAWKTLVTHLEDSILLADSAAVKYGHCCQIAGGAIYDKDKNVEVLHDQKVAALKDLVSELHGKPLLLGFRYRHEGDRIRAALKCPVIDGATTKTQEGEILDQWNAGSLPVLAAQAQTISHGLNLQHGGCQNVCWFGLTDDFDRFDQFNRRVYRQGIQGSTCRFHYIMARGTVDEMILARLKDRDARQQSMFEYLARQNTL